jgi:UDP-N-acetylglucosamine 4,6-dehydratase
LARVLITGGSGFLGQHLAGNLRESHDVVISSRNQKQLLSASSHLGVASAPLDVSNYAATIELFQRLKPQIVIHGAATKFVDLAEKYPNEAIDINIIGSQNVARAAMQTGVEHVIGISTDKAAAPIYNLYGMTKATMERLFVSLNRVTDTSFSIVRYGNVAWSTGSVFPIWKKMLDEKNHIVSTGPDMSRFFFSVSDAVTLVCAAFDNIDVVSGKILSLPMKGTELRRILDIWVESKNATWTLGERRPGDRDLEYLLSKNEAEVTQKIELSSKPYFLMDPTQKTPIQGGLTEEFSSLSAEQFTDSELQDLILTPPAVRFL